MQEPSGSERSTEHETRLLSIEMLEINEDVELWEEAEINVVELVQEAWK